MRPEHWLYTVPLRLRSLFRRREADQELDEELRDHLEHKTKEYIARGMAPAEARRAALIELGGVEQAKEKCRDARRVRWLQDLAQDLRFSLRMLRKSPGFTAVAVLTLGLGIGANTEIFSLIDAVMLRMLPVQNPEQLVQIEFRSPVSADPRWTVTNPIWEQVRGHQDAFAGVFAWRSTVFDLANGGQENTISGIYASGAYFTTLGVHPAAGRLLAPSDDVRGCSGVAVLGYGFWQSNYGGAESAIGSFIRLSGYSFPIVGVAQRGFSGTEIGTPFDVAIPVCAAAILGRSLDARAAWWLSMMGRLKPGVSVEQAGARMKALSPLLFGAVVPTEFSAKSQDVFRKNIFMTVPAATGATDFFGLRRQYGQPLEILMFVVGLVLLIACANIASLLLARSAARQKEIAVRLSLGLLASIWITRLVQQFLFGVKPIDPFSLGGAAIALVAVGLVATYIPARRAMKIEPMEALRYE